MRLTWRDGLATVFVGVAALMYSLWLAGMSVLGLGARGLGGVVLGLGVAASVTAVVYGVGAGLLHASKVYLGISSADRARCSRRRCHHSRIRQRAHAPRARGRDGRARGDGYGSPRHRRGRGSSGGRDCGPPAIR